VEKERQGKYKLVWMETENGPASTAYADDFDFKDGVLWFYSEKPIILSMAVKFIIK
jgi:hypothetical protein